MRNILKPPSVKSGSGMKSPNMSPKATRATKMGTGTTGGIKTPKSVTPKVASKKGMGTPIKGPKIPGPKTL